MRILALDSAATAASCALYEDGALLAESYQRAGLTHSRTLLPMVEAMLSSSGIGLESVDTLAVTAGPGSFTGLRIGISLVKGIADARSLPCIGVSTLESIAACAPSCDAVLCAAMDARAGQVYNALFDLSGEYPVRLTEDRAIRVEDLLKELEKAEKSIIIAGDGAHLLPEGYARLPEHLRFGRAYGTARAAEKLWLDTPEDERKARFAASALAPAYHRLPQAERERLAKANQKE